MITLKQYKPQKFTVISLKVTWKANFFADFLSFSFISSQAPIVKLPKSIGVYFSDNSNSPSLVYYHMHACITARLYVDFPLIERNDNEVDSIKSLPEVDVETEETISSSANIEKEGFVEELYYSCFCDSTQPSVAVRWCMFCQIMICDDHKKVWRTKVWIYFKKPLTIPEAISYMLYTENNACHIYPLHFFLLLFLVLPRLIQIWLLLCIHYNVVTADIFL